MKKIYKRGSIYIYIYISWYIYYKISCHMDLTDYDLTNNPLIVPFRSATRFYNEVYAWLWGHHMTVVGAHLQKTN